MLIPTFQSIIARSRPVVALRNVALPLARSFSSTTASNTHRPTIYALSTHLTRSAIGIIRISGSQSGHIYSRLTNHKTLPKPRLSTVKRLFSPQGQLLDEALVLYFKGPKSYTGEDLLELHVHGGVAIISSVLKTIKSLHDPSNDINIRYAENGEFSQRAFLNGRFDLTEIEGIGEMIDAETESQRVAALSSLSGDTKVLFAKWREEILKNQALLTTVIDFGEDHDIEEVSELFGTVNSNVQQLQGEIKNYLVKVRRSEILLKGIKMILLGPPNAGKSSILNYLSNNDSAIVSDIAGTTRDIIDVPIDIEGYKVIIGDTAGIRRTDVNDKIEIEGIKRAKTKSFGSDLVVIVLPILEDKTVDYDDLLEHIAKLKEENKEIRVILNKEDLVDYTQTSEQEILDSVSHKFGLPSHNIHIVSCTTGNGMESLTQSLVDSFKVISLSDSTDPIIISSRIQDLLENDVLQGFEQFYYWKEQDDVVLACESLRQSIEGIGKITGQAVGIEEILGVVFSSFCIGK